MPKNTPDEVTKIREHKVYKVDYDTENSISFSQFYTYNKCPHQWYLTYYKKLAPYVPSIHALFGTAIHETIQQWLSKLYRGTIKSAIEMNTDELLEERMRKTFNKEKFRNGNETFSSSEEMREFYFDGVHIMKFLKKKRADYFDKKHTYLVGAEIPIVQEVKKNLFFKGYIDLVFYNVTLDKYKIVDIKTSTRGWTDYAKKDEAKIAQIILYKEFFSKQFDVDIDKIDVEYFIVKRKIPLDSDYTAKPVQLFLPASGKIKRGRVMKMFNEFINTVYDENGQVKIESLPANPSKSNCMFCPFTENSYLCNAWEVNPE